MKKLVLGLVIMGVCLIGTDAFALVGIDSYTTLMLHFNGVDGSTAFTDSSFSNHTVTANGNAQVDTAQSKFGGASGFFDGSGDYLAIPDSADWAFGTGDFTVDFWTSFSHTIPIADTVMIWGNYSDLYNFIAFYREGANRKWGVNIQATTGNIVFYSTLTTINYDTWYHIALVRNGNDWKIFQDGVLKKSNTDSDTYPDLATNFSIGGNFNGTYYFNGWLDEFRISKGIARWTSDFTPPTSEYEVIPEPTTLSLLGLGLLGLVFKKKKIA